MRPERIGKADLATCLWPGLPQLWMRGAWSGLLLAVGFSCLLNLLVLTSLVWTELAGPGLRIAAWTAVAVFWAGSALAGWRWVAGQAPPVRQPPDDAFPRAVDEYLKGNWFGTESICQELLARQPRDTQAALLLATVWRHTGRLDDARKQLQGLTKQDEAAAWQWEIGDELKRLDETAAHHSQTPAAAGAEAA